eukprot:TRINITY_DN4804_c0_g1_i1.p2 TRINITY_DN4804_c0_g1~~TRINITY_DN4804_c0_g1_i1.p2  ORF type:complete len:164 (+),score=0.49 TRINITY_DN4804_c0_g1_i1:50-541(+)
MIGPSNLTYAVGVYIALSRVAYITAFIFAYFRKHRPCYHAMQQAGLGLVILQPILLLVSFLLLLRLDRSRSFFTDSIMRNTAKSPLNNIWRVVLAIILCYLLGLFVLMHYFFFSPLNSCYIYWPTLNSIVIVWIGETYSQIGLIVTYAGYVYTDNKIRSLMKK